jgi:hypothetical protein
VKCAETLRDELPPDPAEVVRRNLEFRQDGVIQMFVRGQGNSNPLLESGQIVSFELD